MRCPLSPHRLLLRFLEYCLSPSAMPLPVLVCVLWAVGSVYLFPTLCVCSVDLGSHFSLPSVVYFGFLRRPLSVGVVAACCCVSLEEALSVVFLSIVSIFLVLLPYLGVSFPTLFVVLHTSRRPLLCTFAFWALLSDSFVVGVCLCFLARSRLEFFCFDFFFFLLFVARCRTFTVRRCLFRGAVRFLLHFNTCPR